MTTFPFMSLPVEIQSCILRDAVTTDKTKPEILERVSRSFHAQVNNPDFSRAILRHFGAPFDPSIDTAERILKNRTKDYLSAPELFLLIDRKKLEDIPDIAMLLTLLETSSPVEAVPVINVLIEFCDLIESDPFRLKSILKGMLQKQPFDLQTFYQEIKNFVDEEKYYFNSLKIFEKVNIPSARRFIEEELHKFPCAERDYAIEIWMDMHYKEIEEIRYLDLNDLGLSFLPSWIGKFRGLKDLNLSDNKLSRLPKSIGNLQRLETLDLSQNKLLSLPENIGMLQNLKYLFLPSNQLTTLPKSIGNLLALKRLDLFENNLKTLPETIENLQHITHIRINTTLYSLLPEWLLRREKSFSGFYDTHDLRFRLHSNKDVDDDEDSY